MALAMIAFCKIFASGEPFRKKTALSSCAYGFDRRTDSLIYFISTRSHRYTHASLEKAVPAFKRMSYGELFRKKRLAAASYIFSDFDRLNFWQLELASRAYRALKDAGYTVLNDPALVLQRQNMLIRLNRDGLNSFRAWPATDLELVDRFPVFLRTAAAHRGNLTDLIYDQASLRLEFANLIKLGYPQANLLVIEYRAEPIRDDIFRKLAMFKVGDNFVATPSVHERSWTAKYGEDGIAGEDAYEADLKTVTETYHREEIARAFEAASIDYGRADYGLVEGRVEVYEINTNPYVYDNVAHSSPARVKALVYSRDHMRAAISALDSSPLSPSHVDIELPAIMKKQNRRTRFLRGQFWVP